MKIIKLKNNNGKINFDKLVGNECLLDNKNIVLYEWDNQFKTLGILIENENREQLGHEKISLALGFPKFIDKLNSYGFNLSIEEGIEFSLETIEKAHGLVLAGFNEIIEHNGNYSVDNIFGQTFLQDNELEYLRNNNIIRMNLIDIK